MKKKLLIIFPQGKQLDYIRDKIDNNTLVYVVLKKKKCIRSIDEDSRFVYIDEDCDKTTLHELIPNDVRVLCCHEEALYWLKLFEHKGWTYPFDRVVLSHLRKDKFKYYLRSKNINICEYTLSTNEIRNYPIVAKPSIGFGSIGVRILHDKTELNDYLNNYTNEIENSIIASYSDKYFVDEKNNCIYETFIDGTFYRIPFLVYNGVIQEVFPIRGVETITKENSDFHWIGFEFGKDEKKVLNRIKEFLLSIVELYSAVNGSYVAEIMISRSGEIFLLEFSPRQTSTRISKLVYLATGIDLEKSAIDIFLNDYEYISKSDKEVRLMLKRGENINCKIPGYKLIEKEEENSVFGDCIKVLYYEKE